MLILISLVMIVSRGSVLALLVEVSLFEGVLFNRKVRKEREGIGLLLLLLLLSGR